MVEDQHENDFEMMSIGFIDHADIATHQNRDDSLCKLLPETFQPGKWDVICCGGPAGTKHVGNKRYRVLIANNVTAYQNANSNKYLKSMLVSNIVTSVKEASAVGGFVKKDPLTGRWYELKAKLAREKVSHALRDAIKLQRRKESRPSRKLDKMVLDTTMSIPTSSRKRLDLQNSTVETMERVSPRSLLVPTCPEPSSVLSVHFSPRDHKVTKDYGYDKGVPCVVTSWFGKYDDDDWEKSLKESTQYFLHLEEGSLY